MAPAKARLVTASVGALVYAAAGWVIGSMNAGWFGLERNSNAMLPVLGERGVAHRQAAMRDHHGSDCKISGKRCLKALGPPMELEVVVERKPINPWEWSLQFGFNQAELIEGQRRTLICAGQTSVDANGEPQHPSDMGAQMSLALDNLEAVLAAAGMTLANVIRLGIFTTDVEAFFQNSRVLGERLGPAGVMPPATLLGVKRLAFPGLMIEIEATAAD